MRKLIRRLFVLFIGAVVLNLWLDPVGYFQKTNLYRGDNPLLDKSSRNNMTYLLPETEWLTFSVPSYSDNMKFLFTANLSRLENNPLSEVRDLRFSIIYELLDGDNRPLISKEYHFKTSYLLFMDENQSFQPKSFYLDETILPASTQVMKLALAAFSDANKLRMRIASKDPRIMDISARGYYLEKTSEHRKKMRWERMSEKTQEYLARGNVFPYLYLTQEEIRNLVGASWKPNGPLGVDGEDYHSRRIFFTDEIENLHYYVEAQPQMYADDNLSLSRFLQKGNYMLKLTAIGDVLPRIELRRYNQKRIVFSQELLMGEKEEFLPYKSNEAGIMELISSAAVSISIKDMNSSAPLNLPALIASEYYQSDENTTLHYEFYSGRQRFVRIECRSPRAGVHSIGIRTKGFKGESLLDLQKSFTLIPSRYDYVDPFIVQSEPFYFYLLLSSDVQALEISSKEALDVRLSSRNPDTPYPLHSFFQEEVVEYERLSGWFSLRPKGFDALVAQEKHIRLNKQVRPPFVNPFVQTGRYQYEQLYPLEGYRAYEMLVERPSGEEMIRPQSWSTIHASTDHNREQRIRFNTETDIEYVQPRLVCNKEHETPEGIRIILDGEVVVDRTLFAKSGIISLPSVNVGKVHRFRREGSKALKCYLSHTSDADVLYMKRQFVKLSVPTVFGFEKGSSMESIGVQLAVEEGMAKEPLTFRVVIEDMALNKKAMYESFSFKEYEVHADVSKQITSNITYGNRKLQVADTVYIPLGENLKNGLYRIRVYPPKNTSKAYMSVNHIIFDKPAKARVNKEIL